MTNNDPNARPDPARHARIKAIAEDALDLPTAQRAGFVLKQCADDAALAEDVNRWLEAVHASDREDFLAASPVLDAPAELGEGERRYRIERELGRGGMGTVYLAERSGGGFTQKVAIKLLDASAVRDPDRLRRFNVERQILADLAHPNIARLLDGGRGPGGRPYLVMDFVDGVRIDAWCERARLDAPGRVRLMLKVCAAVAFAHRHLVVHRDLKPANVMVDAQGEPKQLDFGIAKLLDGEDAHATATHERLMTLGYASPEQLRGRAIGTASDVYTLGVLLYRLLTGALPHETSGASLPELARAICEDAPTPPSRRLRQQTDASQALTRARSGDEDLDQILLKCLRAEPEQRYGSVDQFAEDLQRWLDGEPVLARKGSRAYRLRKFAARHRGALALAALLLLLLTGFAFERQRQLVATQVERDRAQRLLGFMTNLFQVADPGEARGRTLTVREVLERGVGTLARDTTLDDASRADLLETSGTVYRRLGLLADADPLLAQAHELQAAASPRDRVRAALALAALRADQARFDDAARLLGEAEQVRAAALSGDESLHARLVYERGNVALRAGRAAEAKPLLEQALAMRQRLSDRPSRELAEVQSALGSAAHDLGDGAGAQRYYESAFLALRASASDAFSQAKVRNNLGMLAVERGDPAAAAEQLEGSLALMREALGERHALIAAVLVNLGGLDMQRGRHAEAERRFTEALQMRSALLGEQHPQTASVLGNLGFAHLMQGRFEQADAALASALDVMRTGAGPKHPATLGTARNLALLRYEQGRLAEAESLNRGIAADAPAGKDGAPAVLALQATLRADAIAWLRAGDAEHGRIAREAADRVIAAAPATAPEHLEAQLWRAQLLLDADRAAACKARDVADTELAKRLPSTVHPQRLWPVALSAACGADATAAAAARAALEVRLGREHPLLHRLASTATATQAEAQ